MFKWIAADGKRYVVKPEDVNEFIRELAGQDFSAKDFRTWLGTLRAFEHLCGCEEAQCLEAVDETAELLRNTRAVARSSYVHPAVLDSHRNTRLRRRLRSAAGRRPRTPPRAGLSGSEHALLRLLDVTARPRRAPPRIRPGGPKSI